MKSNTDFNGPYTGPIMSTYTEDRIRYKNRALLLCLNYI